MKLVVTRRCLTYTDIMQQQILNMQHSAMTKKLELIHLVGNIQVSKHILTLYEVYKTTKGTTSLQIYSTKWVNVFFSAVKDDFLHLVRPVTDPVMPWTGYFTGIVIGSIWYWCADQVINGL